MQLPAELQNLANNSLLIRLLLLLCAAVLLFQHFPLFEREAGYVAVHPGEKETFKVYHFQSVPVTQAELENARLQALKNNGVTGSYYLSKKVFNTRYDCPWTSVIHMGPGVNTLSSALANPLALISPHSIDASLIRISRNAAGLTASYKAARIDGVVNNAFPLDTFNAHDLGYNGIALQPDTSENVKLSGAVQKGEEKIYSSYSYLECLNSPEGLREKRVVLRPNLPLVEIERLPAKISFKIYRENIPADSGSPDFYYDILIEE